MNKTKKIRLSLASIAREFEINTHECSGYGFHNKLYSISSGYKNIIGCVENTKENRVFLFSKIDNLRGPYVAEDHKQFNTLQELRDHLVKVAEV